ncbi:MAG: RNA repair domain-containing protein [Desulfurococcaceae archaeon]
MGRKRGKIEEWLKRVFFSGRGDQYVVFIKHRTDGEEILKPIPGDEISDVRGGFVYVKAGEVIPYHRVVEIRRKNGEVVYRRS